MVGSGRPWQNRLWSPSDQSQIPLPVLYVDADACPVKDEAVRVAERHGLVIHFVSNSSCGCPRAR